MNSTKLQDMKSMYKYQLHCYTPTTKYPKRKVRKYSIYNSTQKRKNKLRNKLKQGSGDFPGDTVVKNPLANVGDMGSIPGPGRSHMPQSN